MPRLGLRGGGNGGSKGGGGGLGSKGSHHGPTSENCLSAVHAYDKAHSRPGGPPAQGPERAEAIHNWVNTAADRGVFDSTRGIKDQAGFAAYIGDTDTNQMSYSDFRGKYSEYVDANSIGRMAGEAVLGAALSTTLLSSSPGERVVSIPDKFSREAKGLMDQMALAAAKRGEGVRILGSLSDPRYDQMEKFSLTVKSDSGLCSEVHYVRNPNTGELMDFKFKRHADTGR